MDSYLIDSDVIMDFSIMGSVMRYISNTTNALLNGEYYYRMITEVPFTGAAVVDEQFILKEGNYSCTNSLSKPVCYQTGVMVIEDYGDLTSGDYSGIESLGKKKINGKFCDAIFSEVNASYIQGMFGGAVEEDLSGINEVFIYSCFDPDTGISLESLYGMSGESNYGGLLMDLGVNITKQTSAFSVEVPESIFDIPYEVVSQEEYDQLVNETYESTSSQNL